MAGIENYLQGFEEQEVQEEKDIVVIRNPTVDLICEKYERWLVEANKISSGFFDVHGAGVNLVKDLKYTSKDIKDFSVLMKVYERDAEFICSGLFLSALINESKEESFEVKTEHLRKNLYYVGFKLKKGNIIIFGNASMPGVQMEGGCITVKGNVENLGGLIKGGKIVVEGDLSSTRDAENLELHVNGNLEMDFSGFVSGAVYHKGKFVYGTRTIPARI